MKSKPITCLFFVIVMSQNVFSQQDTLVDVFPLTIGNEWTYQCHTSFSDLEMYTGSMAGTSTFTIFDSIAAADSIIWKFYNHRFLTYWIHYIYTNVDKSYSISDSLSFDLIELRNGRHQLYRLEGETSIESDPLPFTRFLSDTTMVYRYCPVDAADTIQYQTKDPKSGCYIYKPTFKKGVGLVSIQAEPICIGASYDIYNYLTNSIINSVDVLSLQAPTEYTLMQNFPNPFNPTTTIEYAMPQRTFITLRLFDVVGRDVMSIAEGLQESGIHRVTLTMNKLPSGVYYYRLVTNNFSSTKKLIHLK